LNGAPEAPQHALSPLSPLMRLLFIVIGTGSLGLGILGAILPGMPATVFFLITIACYARSSERLYRWLMTRTWLQRPISIAMSFRQTRAVPVRIKIFAQCVAWSSALYLIFGGRSVIAQCMGIALALSCTIAMAVIKTLPTPSSAARPAGGQGRLIALSLLMGAAGGLVWAIGSAAGWRFANNVVSVPPPSLTDIAPLVVAGLIIGALGGALYLALQGVLPVNQWLRGMVFGAGACGLAVLMVYLLGIAPMGALAGLRALLCLAPMFIAYGLVVSLSVGHLQQASPPS
jgi:uncharacterized protein